MEKLLESKFSEWISKFSGIQIKEDNELCSYYYYILPLMLTETQSKMVEITKLSFYGGGFSRIHLGKFKN